MNCTNVQQNLKAFVDGELGRVARLSVALHLARCRACRAEMEAVEVVSDEISKLDAPEQSDGMREAVLNAAREGRPSPPRAAGRRVRSLVLAAGGGALVVAAALFLVLRPAPAQAALQRVIAASEAVKTCHMEWRLGQPDGPQARHALWYDEGEFRMEEWQNGELESVQVYSDGRLDTYITEGNRVLRGVSDQPFGTDFEGFSVAALIKAEGSEAQVERDPVRVDGRTLYRFTITREREDRLVVLADPVTDLPVSIEFYGSVDDGWEKVGESEVIEYDSTLDPGLFVLNPPEGAVEIDQGAVATAWQQRFDAGLMRSQDGDQEAVLRDFQVTTGGDVFAIWTAGFPSVDHSVSLTDSLGTTYLYDTEGHGYFQAWAKPCAWFVPVTPLEKQPAWYSLSARNGHHSFTFHVDEPELSPSADPVYPTVPMRRGEAGFLYPAGTEGELARAEMRAVYWRDKGDARQALRYYEEMIAAAEGKMSLQATAWLDVGTLYEQTGQRVKAHEAYRRGFEFHRRDLNRDNPDQQEVAEKLEQGLRRTR